MFCCNFTPAYQITMKFYLHMPLQHSCHNMCKIFSDHNFVKCKTKFQLHLNNRCKICDLYPRLLWRHHSLQILAIIFPLKCFLFYFEIIFHTKYYVLSYSIDVVRTLSYSIKCKLFQRSMKTRKSVKNMKMLCNTIDSRYIMVVYNTIVHTAQQLQCQNLG